MNRLSGIIENAVRNVNLIKIRAISRILATAQFIAFIIFAIKSAININVPDIFLAVLFLSLCTATKALGVLAGQALSLRVIKEEG